ncbi:MAG: hypothetical protein OXG16_14360 [Rhodospirillales bacterium]|nr:hypothetical protein [Rhodospirillales bacterium]MDE0711036.1 hypothetical protein [Rhodospirillales bacterium]
MDFDAAALRGITPPMTTPFTGTDAIEEAGGMVHVLAGIIVVSTLQTAGIGARSPPDPAGRRWPGRAELHVNAPSA